MLPCCDALIVQLIEHEIGNLMVASSSPALGIGKNGHLSTQQQNGYLAYRQGWHYGYLTSTYNGSGVMLTLGVEMVQECTGPIRG